MLASPATAGGHFNPAVSCAVFFAGRDNNFTGRKALLYSVVQVLSGSRCGRVACDMSFHVLSNIHLWHLRHGAEFKLLKLKLQHVGQMPLPDWLLVDQASLQLSLPLVYLASQCQPSDRKLHISWLRRGFFWFSGPWNSWTSLTSWNSWTSLTCDSCWMDLSWAFFQALLGELIFTFTLSYVVLCVAVSNITKAGPHFAVQITKPSALLHPWCKVSCGFIPVLHLKGQTDPIVSKHDWQPPSLVHAVKDAYS